MKSTNFNFLFVILILLFSSCDKAKDTELKSVKSTNSLDQVLAVAGGEAYYKYVSLVSSYTINPIDRANAYSTEIFGKISTNGIPQNAGPLVVGNKTINPNSSNLYYYKYPLSESKTIFGKSLSCSVSDAPINSSGASPNGVTHTVMVVPKELYPSNIPLPGTKINRAENYSITWNPDPTNQFHKVQIEVYYLKSISQYNSSGMPNDIEGLIYQTDDDGNFTIPKADLARFPNKAFVRLSIARAWLDNTTSDVAYVSIVEAHTVPLLVVEAAPIFAKLSITNKHINRGPGETVTLADIVVTFYSDDALTQPLSVSNLIVNYHSLQTCTPSCNQTPHNYSKTVSGTSAILQSQTIIKQMTTSGQKSSYTIDYGLNAGDYTIR